MASASVSATAGLDKADCLGSVGRRWANSPITAHPKRRMHGIPLRVVQFKPQGSQVPTLNPGQRKLLNQAGKKKAENTPVMHRPASARKAFSFSPDCSDSSSAD